MAVPAFSTALAFFDGIRSERLPANLLQAQRDYFGARASFVRMGVPAPVGRRCVRAASAGGRTRSASLNLNDN